MRMHPFHRTELLVGGDGFARLSGASVCVVGLGGVGSHAAEALARSGVGSLTLVDFDQVCLTNLNRQVMALRSTVGERKVDLMAARVADIHPRAEVRALPLFYSAETTDVVLDRSYDAVLDCIDNMATKLHLLDSCAARGLPVWSAMGAGGRMDPTRVRVTDVWQTRVDPFARIVRKNLRQRGVTGPIQAVWTDEPPQALDAAAEEGFRCICPDRANSPNSCDRRFQVQGSVAWMPAIFGLTMAAAVVHAVIGRPLGGHASAPADDEEEAPGAVGPGGLTLLSREDWDARPPGPHEG